MIKKYALAQVKAAADDDEDPNGSFEVILSAPTLDRDGEVLAEKAFDPLPDHVTFDIDHGMSTASTVGSGVPRYEDGVLKVAGTFSSIPRAQEVRTLVKEGHIRTTSVAYMGAKYEQKDGVPTLVKAELLNGAFVAIPSNREAVVLSSKAYADRVAGLPEPTGRAPLFKGHGMTANDLSTAISAAVEDLHGGERRWTWVRDYTDEWVVFSVDGMEPTGMFQQDYSVTERVVSLSGDAKAVTARTVYEPVPTSSTTDSAPETAAAPAAAKSPASVVAQTRLALAQAGLLLDS